MILIDIIESILIELFAFKCCKKISKWNSESVEFKKKLS